MKLNKLVQGLIMILAIVFIIGCQGTIPGDQPSGRTNTQLAGSDDLKKFNSEEEIIEFLEKSQQQMSGDDYYYSGSTRSSVMSVAMESDASAPVAAKAYDEAQSAGGTAGSYSSTNVQVQGVDEADFVKNDGKYIYQIVQDKLVIVEAYPAEDADIVSETKIDGRPRNLYINQDRLVLFVDGEGTSMVLPRYGIVPEERYKSETHIVIYDISDRSNPKEVQDYSIDGYYMDSRMIGEQIYAITQDSVYYHNDIIDMPVLRAGSTKIMAPDVYYFDNPDWNYAFNTVASIDIFGDQNDVNAQTFMMGYSGTLYVSENNIYITYQKHMPWAYYQDESEQRFYDIAVPLLPSDVQEEIKSIQNDDSLNAYQQWDQISDVIETMYNTMDEDDKKALIKRIQDAQDDYDVKRQQESQKTIIHRIAIDDGTITYGAKGEVPGYLLNQFSLDEHNDNLRVATTNDYWTRQESVQYNNVYVLNSALEIIGKKEGIAAKERIYSTRFIGDRLYMVTFRQVDPFFVIDLSNPLQPEILGELKIPGFSDYLHPYDDNHIIGIGKDTKENEWGGVTTLGVKLALFDVSDVTSPKQVGNYVIGKSGTHSEALYDHKAFLFSKDKNTLVIPIREVIGEARFDENLRYYREQAWQGAYVFSLTPEDGFDLRGKITHSEDEEQQDYWYGSPSAVRRALYMDDVLYTISDSKIMANDLNTIEELATIELPYEQPRDYYPYPIYKGGVGVAEPAVASSAPAQE